MSLGTSILAVATVLVAQAVLTQAKATKEPLPTVPNAEAVELVNDVIRTDIKLVPNRKMGRNYLASAVAEVEIMYYIPPGEWERAGRNEQQVWQYYEMLTHATNVMYETLTSPKIVLRMCGVRIFKTRSEVSFLTDRDLTAEKLELDESLKVLKKFQRWLAGERRRGALSSCDVHVYSSTNSCCGWAGLSALCWQPQTASDRNEAGNGLLIVDKIGSFQGILILAHEVAHTLGVDHDGEGDSRDCSPQEGHIMDVTNSYTEKFGTWSPCSIRKMRQFLSSTAGMCAFRRSCTRHYAPTKARISWYHGQEHDQQCQTTFDPFLQTPHIKYLRAGPVSCRQLNCRTQNTRYEGLPYTVHRVPGGPCAPGSYCRFFDKQCVPGTFSPPDFSTVY